MRSLKLPVASASGSLVTRIDDFAPMGAWPPRHGDRPDLPRLHWLTHPDLLATELRVAADLAVLVARLRAPA